MNLKDTNYFCCYRKLLIIIYQYKRVIDLDCASIHCKIIDLRNLFNKFKNTPANRMFQTCSRNKIPAKTN